MNYGQTYTNIFKLILSTIKTKDCSNFSELLSEISNDETIIELRNELNDDNKSISYIQDILNEQLKLNLVVGTSQDNKDGKFFTIERLSPNGYIYLDEVSKPNFWEKFKNHAKENGLALTAENITKFIANSLWD